MSTYYIYLALTDDTMKLLALSIGGQSSLPTYTIQVPFLNGIDKLHIQNVLSFAITLLLTASVLLALFFLLFGGLRWIVSQGDKKQLEEAQKTVQYSIVGLVLILVSFFIINFIGFIFGVNLLRVQF